MRVLVILLVINIGVTLLMLKKFHDVVARVDEIKEIVETIINIISKLKTTSAGSILKDYLIKH